MSGHNKNCLVVTRVNDAINLCKQLEGCTKEHSATIVIVEVLGEEFNAMAIASALNNPIVIELVPVLANTKIIQIPVVNSFATNHELGDSYSIVPRVVFSPDVANAQRIIFPTRYNYDPLYLALSRKGVVSSYEEKERLCSVLEVLFLKEVAKAKYNLIDNTVGEL